MKKLVILDRDGVINLDSPNFIKSLGEWVPIPGSLEAIALLCDAGFRVTVATNQSGVARGLFDLKTLHSIHQKIQEEAKALGGEIDTFFFCPHGPDEGCLCRKPRTGLFNQIERHYQMNFEDSKPPSIGDSLRDLQASQLAFCRPFLVLTGNGKTTQEALPPTLKNTVVFEDLLAAARYLIKEMS